MENNENNDLNFDNRVPLEELRNTVEQIKKELSTIIVGQKDFIELLIISILADQLGAQVDFKTDSGVAFTMSFPRGQV